MQLETLKIFCDVVRWGSFSKGATENGIAQPSASQAVHQLEQRLGVKLLDRSKRPLVTTPHGKIFYEGCKDLVERFEEVENRVRALNDAGNVVGTVTVASIYSVGLAHMKWHSQEFEKRYPGAKVRVEYLHPTRVLESVAHGDSELGLISYPKKWPELVVTPWREEEMVLVVSPTHRLAGRGSVDVSALDGETLVGFDPELSIRKAIDRFLRHHEVAVTTALEFDNIENIKRAVEVSAGVALLPEPTLTRELESGSLSAARIEGQEPGHRLTRPLAFLHRRQHQLSLTASRFLKWLTEEGGGVASSATAADPHPRASAGPLDPNGSPKP
ncbi:MAG: LysR family transcriptional regulator [Isosphaeraceae bacterium]